jgi:light-regulated signal transduction histidine kinase (bacteriophytochrome)
VKLTAKSSSCRIVIGELPVANGDTNLIRMVWYNLLGNAVKFSAGLPEPITIISGYTNHNEAVYSIKDNGVGFNPEYMDKLFGVFNRLHSKEDFEGTGVGLSIVRRIIIRHGGRVWAESHPGSGATFYFSLPLTNRENNDGNEKAD